MGKKEDTQKLIAEGYEVLECIRCEQKCEPVRLNDDGSVSYATHLCDNGYEILPKRRSFKIAAGGEYKMNGF